MTTITAEARREASSALKWGVNLMTLGALAFIGYAVIFFVLNFHLGLIYLATAIFIVGAALSGKALLDEQTR
jgi:hypothetical protein